MNEDQFTKRALILIALVSAVVLLLLFLGHIFSVLLIVVGAILVAVFFDGIAKWLSERLPLSKTCRCGGGHKALGCESALYPASPL